MVILRSQNKITDFFMILVWASPFKHLSHSQRLNAATLLFMQLQINEKKRPISNTLHCCSTQRTINFNFLQSVVTRYSAMKYHAIRVLPCKAKMQYLFTLQVSRYCLWLCVAEDTAPGTSLFTESAGRASNYRPPPDRTEQSGLSLGTWKSALFIEVPTYLRH